jgi:ATP-binding cassette, subfamily B, bacterial HlyB/CyaB
VPRLGVDQKQRLEIARALIKRSKILIFDEAMSVLDAKTVESVAATINRYRDSLRVRNIVARLVRARWFHV